MAHRVTGHIDGVSVAVKAAHAGTDEKASPEPAESSDHVHDSRAGKVNVSGVEEVSQAVPSIAHPAVLRPGPMGNNRVDPCRDDERVAC